MSTEPENLVLELLRAIRGDIGQLRDDMTEVKMRLGSLERGLASVEHRLADMTGDRADYHARIDRLAERVARIERRLELSDQ